MLQKRLSRQERRQQLLKTAMELFAQHGFDGVTTRQIAEQAGVTEAVIFQHFGTKEDLCAAIIEEKMKDHEPVLTGMLEKAASRADEEVLREMAVYILRELGRDPTFHRLLLFSALTHHPLARIFFEERVDRLCKLFENFVEERIRQGKYRQIDPVLAMRIFSGMLFHHAMMEQIYERRDLKPLSNDELAGTFVQVFLDGMRRRDSEGKP